MAKRADHVPWGIISLTALGLGLIVWSVVSLLFWPPGADGRRGSPGYPIFLDHYHRLGEFGLVGALGLGLIAVPLFLFMASLLPLKRDRG